MINKSFKKLFKNFNQVAKDIKVDLSLRPSQLDLDKYYKITEFYELLKND
jgi:16S rRNA A1518/A1519 N6-dimethyltransferase RsmA/KsgA/DIM1 with predicted DNA glycosylase/AP lyase activity